MSDIDVLLDCDGVLADFVASALRIVQDLTGTLYPAEQIQTWEVFDSLPVSEDVKKETYRRMKGRGGCLSIPVIPGAQEAVAKLAEVSNVYIVTAGFRGSETWTHERELWLDKHFGSSIKDVIHAHAKDRVHGDVFVDDKHSHVEKWARYWVVSGKHPFARPLLWSTPRGNGKPNPFVEQVSTWAQVLEQVESVQK